MYEVIEIVEDVATRMVTVRNCETGAVDVCFDDSAVVSDENFGFMEPGQKYACKIKLFGEAVEEKVGKSLTCTVTDSCAAVGQKQLVEVRTDRGVYYVYAHRAGSCQENSRWEFLCTRKDLIEVDYVVHGDFLR